MRWRVSFRAIVYVTLSLAVSLPFLADVHLRFHPSAKHWLVLAALNLAIWCSWPRYPSLVLRQATMTVTLLIAANLLLSPLVSVVVEEPIIRHLPNQHLRIRHAGDLRPGIEGVHESTTNARGHRTNGPIDYANKPADALRIVAIGASTTQQIEMDDRKTWTSLVAQDLSAALGRKVEMINTGVAGVRGRQYYLALRESEAYAPDVALFLTGINDWVAAIRTANRPPRERAMRMLLPFSFFESVLFNGAMAGWGAISPLLRPSDGTDRIVDDVGDPLMADNNSVDRRRNIDFRLDSVDGEYAYWIGRIMSECKRRSIACLFLDQPTAYGPDIDPDLRKRLWMTPMHESYTLGLDGMQRIAATYNGWLADTARRSGLPFCPVAASFPPRAAYFYDDCHFTTAGSRKLATLVTDCLLGLPGLSRR